MNNQLISNTLHVHSVLEQRYPFIFIDRVIELEPGKYIRAIKNISNGCPYYHKETGTIPLFVILELMGQLSEVLLRQSYHLIEKRGLLVRVEDFEMNNYHAPYENFNIKNEMLVSAAGMYKTKSTIFINNQLLCRGVFIHVFK